MSMIESARKILKTINDEGHEAFIVGGYVRDVFQAFNSNMVKVETNDIDIVTNCSVDKLTEMFQCYDIGKSKDFGIVCVKMDEFDFEVANYRADVYHNGNGLGADGVKIVDNITEDLARRDFTINAMAVDINDEVVDPFGGQEDMFAEVIRSVGNPDERFAEDYVRMLRGIRFAAKLNFTIHSSVSESIQKNAHNILKIAPERIQKELIKMASMGGYKFAKSLQLMKDFGILKHILPEVDVMDQYEHHYSVHPEGATVRPVNG
jgi:tRNA nucleotidyltransferase (CCA-adding enzyme)